MTTSPVIESQWPVFGPMDALVSAILTEALEPVGISVTTQYYKEMQLPAILVSSARGVGTYSYHTDRRFLRKTVIRLDCLTRGVDAKDDAHDVLEAADVALTRALLESRVYPGLGNLSFLKSNMAPTEVNDYATSTGAVQYASLPHDVIRSEMIYRVGYRPDADQSRVTNPYLRQAPSN